MKQDGRMWLLWPRDAGLPARRAASASACLRARLSARHFFRLLIRVVRRAHQRADRRVPEAHRVRLALEHRERVRDARSAAPADGRPSAAGTGRCVSMSMSCARMSRITGEDFVVGLAQAHHQAGLGRHRRKARA